MPIYRVIYETPKNISIISFWSQEPRSSLGPRFAFVVDTVKVMSAMLVHGRFSFACTGLQAIHI
jgi:hypothetical protein